MSVERQHVDSWPCLMFHDVLPRTNASGGGAERFAVPSAAFERVLDAIVAAGYRGCSLERALALKGQRRVAITFDDGTRGQFENAVPALRARGMTATFFVTTDWIGRTGYASWDELRQLVSWGMSVQSHTRTHPFLSELDEGWLRSELVGSKDALDAELKQSTSQIALPGGDVPRPTLNRVLWECGYRVVAGSRWGLNRGVASAVDGPFIVRRCTMRGEVCPQFVKRVIDGDPWLRLRRSVRELSLGRIRSTLGPARYARWRRRLLDALANASRWTLGN